MTYYTSCECVGNYIYYRGIDDKGKRFKEKISYLHTFYIPANKSSKFKTLEGQYVETLKPGSINECRDFFKNYDGVENFKIYGNHRYEYAYIQEKHADEVEYDATKIRIAFLDIETGSENGFPNVQTANEEVIAITVKIADSYLVFGCGDFENKDKDVKYFKCKSERDLLMKFLDAWSAYAPDAITGWNTDTFDVPYLVNRINRILGDKYTRKLSTWGRVREGKSFGMRGREIQIYHIGGVSDLDYLRLYRKFTYVNQESYRLDHIANVELGEKKLDYSEYATLHTLYKENFQKFIEYNIKDVKLIVALEEKLKLLEMAIGLAYHCKVNFSDVFGQVRMWDNLICDHLIKKGIVIPPHLKEKNVGEIEGAYVKDPIVGMHKWVVSFDLNSLYPHLIMQYNISPETLVVDENHSWNVKKLMDGEFSEQDNLEENNRTITPNGVYFRTDVKGFLPEIMEKMYNDRVKVKKKMIIAQQQMEKTKDTADRFELYNKIAGYHTKQINLKISLNSAYGAFGNQYFRYYDKRLAEAVTLSGQLSIRWIERDLNKYLNELLKPEEHKDYILAVDTDSVYVSLDDLVKKVFDDDSDTEKVIDFLDKVCEGQIQKVIDNSYSKLRKYTSAPTQKMIMKREILGDKGIWTAKKRYILNVHDTEGVRYEKPKLKIMGIEAVRSSTPSACREKLKELFNLIMNTDEDTIINFIDGFRKQFKELPAEEVSFPRQVSDLGKYRDSNSLYTKGTPIHVKGALIHNKLLTDKKLTRNYPLINEGEKIKFSYLKKPNPTGDTVIAMNNTLPKEFGLDKYIDYDMQFEKSFIHPVKLILDTIGWEVERKSTLESFFG